jgi:hypothetical protein
MQDAPDRATLLTLRGIKDVFVRSLLGKRLETGPTKNRGQALEEALARALGYRLRRGEILAGGYPDIRHQALEVKVQESPTVDLGKFTPQFVEDVPRCPGFTTGSIRYLIALADAATNMIQGAVICPGGRLGDHFAFVADTSFKCQRSIPMAFFDEFDGRAVSDPEWPH